MSTKKAVVAPRKQKTTTRVVAPLKPRPHQAEAIKAAVTGLKKHKRGQVIMACGTGKTLVGAQVADKLKAQTLLVFVPSLLLARQLLEAYQRQWPNAMYLAVCSDVDRKVSEENPDAGKIACESTTAGATVVQFLKTTGRRIVIATYQSAYALEGLKFDGAIFDEAHRTAGVKGKPFAFGLHDRNIKCGWRLFMTATPRHAEIVSDAGETKEVYSMDDVACYGPALHTLPFRKAIDLGLIVDYRIVVSVFNLDTKAPTIASQIALRRAMKRYGVSKVFTFHNTVARARSFGEAANVWGTAQLFHVNGKQPSASRTQLLQEFAQADRAIMSNCKCLGEGVDLPSVDMVAFVDSKKSTVDIVQAIGRAMRNAPGKKRALIFLPIFVNMAKGEKAKDAATRSGFKKVYEIAQALREQDVVMAAELAAAARGDRSALPTNIEIDVAALKGTSQAMAARIARYVRVRMLQPFGFSLRNRKMCERARVDLLRLAAAGAPRPSAKSSDAWTRVLGDYLNSMGPRGNDRAFFLKLQKRAPLWFARDRSAHYQAEILRLAAQGPRRNVGRLINDRLRGYIKNDPVFTARLRKVNKSWLVFNGKVQMQRKRESLRNELFQLARMKQPRPSVDSQVLHIRRLANALSALSREDRKALVALNPSWRFGLPAERKAELLSLARTGGEYPTGVLAKRLGSYMDKSSGSYDAVFVKDIRKCAPSHWWPVDGCNGRYRIKRRILLEALALAKAGKAPPSVTAKNARLRAIAAAVHGHAKLQRCASTAKRRDLHAELMCELRKFPKWKNAYEPLQIAGRSRGRFIARKR